MTILPGLWTRKLPLNFGSNPRLDHEDPKTEKNFAAMCIVYGCEPTESRTLSAKLFRNSANSLSIGFFPQFGLRKVLRSPSLLDNSIHLTEICMSTPRHGVFVCLCFQSLQCESKSSPPPLKLFAIFSNVKFCQYVASLYLHIFTNFGRFILIFNKMALIFLGVPVVLNLFQFQVSSSQIAITSSPIMSGPQAWGKCWSLITSCN